MTKPHRLGFREETRDKAGFLLNARSAPAVAPAGALPFF
jgi:hypothetical protein